jgi:HAD superfamily hydrolase (TIGR01662 family)
MTDSRIPRAVLFDRDGTLVVDVPYNGSPGEVRPMPTARAALDRVRALGIPVGVVTNQSGIARGFVSRRQVDAVNREVERQLGPFDVWELCPHGPEDGCVCRKPLPGMIHSAAERLGVPAEGIVMVGDIGADMAAARAAGARGILVPTPITLAEEIDAATEVATDLLDAVERALSGSAVAS